LNAIRLILLNTGIFLLIRIVWIIAPSSVDGIVDTGALSPSFSMLATHPWALLTYMFLHLDFWHMLVNMLWLSWFGLLLERVAGPRMVTGGYLAGGVAGGLCYILAGMVHGGVLNPGTCLLGASAATFAVVTATLICIPDKRIDIPAIGSFRLKWIASLGLALFAAASLDMSGPQIAAHAGGAAAGIVAAVVWRSVTRRKMEHMKILAKKRVSHMALIEKTRKSGYASLSRAERMELFHTSSSENSFRATNF